MSRNVMRRILLTLLIFVSFLLSWLIWSGRSLFINREMPTPVQSQMQSQNSVYNALSDGIQNIFGPAQLIYHYSGQSEMINIKNFLDVGGHDFIDELNFYNLREVDEITAFELSDRLREGSSFVCAYDEFIYMSVFGGKFDEALTEEQLEMTYDYIVFPLDERSRILFYNSSTQKLYEAVSDGDVRNRLNETLENSNVQRRAVQPYVIGENMMYLPTNELIIDELTYFMGRIPNAQYVDQLFDTRSEVNVRYLSNSVRFNDLNSELRINDVTNVLIYTSQSTEVDVNPNYRLMMDRSYSTLQRFVYWQEGLHFNSIEENHGRLNFRRYIEGFPIFSESSEAIVEISLDDNELTYLRTGLQFVRTPLDLKSEERTVILPPGREIITVLLDSNLDHLSIQNIRVGLTWTVDPNQSNIVRFIPEWYVQYDDRWIAFDKLIESR